MLKVLASTYARGPETPPIENYSRKHIYVTAPPSLPTYAKDIMNEAGKTASALRLQAQPSKSLHVSGFEMGC